MQVILNYLCCTYVYRKSLTLEYLYKLQQLQNSFSNCAEYIGFFVNNVIHIKKMSPSEYHGHKNNYILHQVLKKLNDAMF